MRFSLIMYSSQEGAAVTQYESLFRTSCVHRRSPNEEQKRRHMQNDPTIILRCSNARPPA